MLNIESWGKDCARKQSGQQCSQFLRCSEFVFEMLRIFMRCSEFFWDALNFFFEMLWTFCWDVLIFVWDALNGHNDFIIRAAASAPLPPPIYASFEALKLWGQKNCALLAVTPLRCITSDQFIRSTDIKWRFCPFHCMHFDTLGHSDTSMYLISVPKDGNLIDIKLALSSFIWYWNGAYFQKWIFLSYYHHSFPHGKCC